VPLPPPMLSPKEDVMELKPDSGSGELSDRV